MIAEQAGHLTVFQRTPQYTVPARHASIDRRFIEEEVKPNYDAIIEKGKWTSGGSPVTPDSGSALALTEEERNSIFEKFWEIGGNHFIYGSFDDTLSDKKANDIVAEFIRSKIRETVKDPETAQKLLPLDHPYGSKRALMDTNYFETYNRENVDLVDLRQTPIQEITAKGIRTSEQDFEFDIIVFATGFDAMTGTFMKIDIRGRDGMTLREKWSEGPKTYLGLQVAGFPNMFMITGPGSPSVLCNMPVCIEQHIDWVGDFIGWMRERDIETAEPDPRAEEEWCDHVNEEANKTLFVYANSWYLGANIPGKPRVFMPYAGGQGTYRKRCNEVAENGYEGFVLGAGDDRLPHVEKGGDNAVVVAS